MHVDDIELLRIAFPKADEPVEEALVHHVMCCRECWEYVHIMRELAETLPQLKEENGPTIEYGLPADSVAISVGKAEYATLGSNGDFLPSAAMNDDHPCAESYLDSDSVNSWRINSDDADDGEMMMDLPGGGHGEFNGSE